MSATIDPIVPVLERKVADYEWSDFGEATSLDAIVGLFLVVKQDEQMTRPSFGIFPKEMLSEGFGDVIKWGLSNQLIWFSPVNDDYLYLEILDDKLLELLTWMQFQNNFEEELGSEEDYLEYKKELEEIYREQVVNLAAQLTDKNSKELAVCVSTQEDAYIELENGNYAPAFPLSIRQFYKVVDRVESDTHRHYDIPNSLKDGVSAYYEKGVSAKVQHDGMFLTVEV